MAASTVDGFINRSRHCSPLLPGTSAPRAPPADPTTTGVGLVASTSATFFAVLEDGADGSADGALDPTTAEASGLVASTSVLFDGALDPTTAEASGLVASTSATFFAVLEDGADGSAMVMRQANCQMSWQANCQMSSRAARVLPESQETRNGWKKIESQETRNDSKISFSEKIQKNGNQGIISFES
jgi:hypothetical protein